MDYNYSKLLGKITEMFSTQMAFSSAMGISERSLSLKLNNRVGFKQMEIINACTLLSIPENEISQYFFDVKVH